MTFRFYFCFLIPFLSATAQVKVGDHVSSINSSSVFEIESTTKGFLLPRMSTLQRLAITTPAAGLQVYDTTTNSIWCYNDSVWMQLANASLLWSNLGNSGTNSNTNFIGTTDNVGLSFRTNNSTKMVITTGGFVGIGTTAPNVPLQFASVAGNRKIVLFETANNTHQFYGFGVNSSAMRYQVDNLTSDHVFFAAASNASSNELFRIKGNGRVGIGTSTPTTLLDVNGSARVGALSGTGTRIVTSNATGNLGFINNGSDGQTLQISAGVPTWSNATSVIFGNVPSTATFINSTVSVGNASITLPAGKWLVQVGQLLGNVNSLSSGEAYWIRLTLSASTSANVISGFSFLQSEVLSKAIQTSLTQYEYMSGSIAVNVTNPSGVTLYVRTATIDTTGGASLPATTVQLESAPENQLFAIPFQ